MPGIYKYDPRTFLNESSPGLPLFSVDLNVLYKSKGPENS